MEKGQKFHTDGILHHLGTNFGTEPWTHPLERGLIGIRLSDSSVISSLNLHEKYVNYDRNTSWISFDFGDTLKSEVKPVAYTLGYRLTCEGNFIRLWALEGQEANHENDWLGIKEHKEDTSLDQKGVSYTWPIVGAGNYFQQFRIKLIGADEHRDAGVNLLDLDFEIYGHLRKF